MTWKSGAFIRRCPGGARPRLLVADRSDREIADGLFISHRTAQGHVAAIFGKLRVNSRTAAATAALAAGLVTADPGSSPPGGRLPT